MGPSGGEELEELKRAFAQHIEEGRRRCCRPLGARATSRIRVVGHLVGLRSQRVRRLIRFMRLGELQKLKGMLPESPNSVL